MSYSFNFQEFKKRTLYFLWLETKTKKHLFKTIRSFEYGASVIPNHTHIQLEYNGTKRLSYPDSMIRILEENNIPYESEQVDKILKLQFTLHN
jgi:hypothetical protein